MSACGACQSAVWIDWPEWAYNCTKVLPPSAFPNPVPEGTSIPQWALLDVTRSDLALWDPFKAEAVGDSPEIGPDALIGISSSFTTGPTGASNPTVYPAITSVTSFSSSQPLPANSTVTPSASSGGGPDTGAIVGGVLGGIAVISVAVVGAVYRFRQRVKTSPAAFVVGDAPQPRNQVRSPLSDDETRASFSMREAPIPSMRDHVSQNPNEPTTFPKTEEAPYALTISAQATFAPYNGAGNSLATMQISQSRVYHGPPTAS